MWVLNLIKKIMAIFSSLILLVFGIRGIEYTINFVNFDGAMISSLKVSQDEFATPPLNPEKSGATFIGWSGNYFCANNNETVKAVFDDEKNVIVVSNTSGKIGDTVKVLIKIDGKVKTCGFDLTINYSDELELVSIDDDLDLDIVSNSNTGSNIIYLNFSSATDKTKSKDIIELTFKVKETTKSALPIEVSVEAIKEISGNKVVDTEYVVVDGFVKTIV